MPPLQCISNWKKKMIHVCEKEIVHLSCPMQHQSEKKKLHDSLSIFLNWLKHQFLLEKNWKTTTEFILSVRLKITTPPRKTKSSSREQRSAKRRRVEDESSITQSATTSGVVAIVESDFEGNFVKLHNTSDTVRKWAMRVFPNIFRHYYCFFIVCCICSSG